MKNLILRRFHTITKKLANQQTNKHRMKRHISSKLFASTLMLVLITAYQNCAREMKIEQYTAPSTGGKFSTMNASLEDTLNDPQAVLDTISDTANSAFSCLRTANTPCLNGTEISITVNRIHDIHGELLLDDLVNPRRGLNALQEQCDTYNYLNSIEGMTDPDCQTRIDIRWQPTCNSNTLSCSNSNLVHKFKITYLTSKRAAPKNILSEKIIDSPASLFQLTPYSDAKGSGVSLLSVNTTTNAKQRTPCYHTCNSNLINSGSGACSCASGLIEDLDSSSNLCMQPTQSCTNSVANTAVCKKEYNATTNSYVLNASDTNMFRCQSGYTAYNGQCRQTQTACSVTNGSCVNNFNASTGGYTQVITCNSGYGKPAANQSLCLPITWTSAIRDQTTVFCYGDTARHTYTQYYRYTSATNKGNGGLSITPSADYTSVYGREGSTANGGFTITCTLKM